MATGKQTLEEYTNSVLIYLSNTDIEHLMSIVEKIAGKEQYHSLADATGELIQTAYELNVPPSQAASSIYLGAVAAFESIFGNFNDDVTRH